MKKALKIIHPFSYVSLFIIYPKDIITPILIILVSYSGEQDDQKDWNGGH